ncbi:MAG: 30S ribosomal protein S7 [Proteobacteria bacterium]|nr:30S ribosomal protein S7 [Pseudomonadota bacterium]
MSRRQRAEKRQVMPDPVYGNVIATKFMNLMMKDGKKGTAEKIFYGALDGIKEKTGRNPIEVFLEAMEKVAPSLEVKSKRVGGATYQVPMEVKPVRSQALAIRWLVAAARKRSDKTMQDRLMNEFLDASTEKGASIKKRDDTHKMAEANKAFAHFRW